MESRAGGRERNKQCLDDYGLVKKAKLWARGDLARMSQAD
jgi:hypothetical protein